METHSFRWQQLYLACLMRVPPMQAAREADEAMVIVCPELAWIPALAGFIRKLQRIRACRACGKVTVPHGVLMTADGKGAAACSGPCEYRLREMRVAGTL